MSTAWENISQHARPVSLPAAYLRLKTVLDDPRSNLADVADVVGKDPAMAARLLRIVNSAYFGLATEVDTVSRAVALLGTQDVHDLMLAASVTQSFEGLSDQVVDMERFWLKSVLCAICARELATLCNVLDSERLFVGGLLRDIGHLLIYQAEPHKAQRAIELAQLQNAPLYKAERAVLGIDYARVGAELMRQWQLPRSLWEPTEFHIEPKSSGDYALFTALVHIAAVLADAPDRDQDIDSALETVSGIAWELTGLSPAECALVPHKAHPQVTGVMQLILPHAQAA